MAEGCFVVDEEEGDSMVKGRWGSGARCGAGRGKEEADGDR
jgi:hypothetical protein